MPTRWNPDWPQAKKDEFNAARRRRYALKQTAQGKTYSPRVIEKEKPIEQMFPKATSVLKKFLTEE